VARQVNTSGLERLTREAESGDVNPDEAMRKFAAEFPHELAKVRGQVAVRNPRSQLRMGDLYPVEIDGSPSRGLKQGYFKTPLRDGTLGYLQRRTDDCVQAVIASLLQMPPYLVPDPHVEELRAVGREDEEIDRVVDQKFAEWTADYGLTLTFHATPPTWAKRWIGMITADNPDDTYSNHTLLMTGRDVLFDPAHLLPPADAGTVALEGYRLDGIDYGITIERR
jgi:hypothetical protein